MQVILDELGHRFRGGPWLFRGLSQTLIPGHVYALTGPSGSGKSTLLSLMAGWVKPAEGTLINEGINSTRWVFQNPHGTPKRRALDHVILPFLARGIDLREAETNAKELLEVFGLSRIGEQPFASLSGGEAQRLMLARGIASDPDLFLVDEPTAQLDLVTRREVNEAIKYLSSATTIVVIATHDEETKKSCTNIIDLLDAQQSTNIAHLGSTQ